MVTSDVAVQGDVTVDAIRFEQNGKVMYMVVLAASLLRKFMEVHHWNPKQSPGHKHQGYQRPLELGRVKKYGKYVVHDAGICPPLIANDRNGSIRWDEKKKQITLSASLLLQLIDGQHREGGFEWIRTEVGFDAIGNYEVPIMITTFPNVMDEMEQFEKINRNQKGVAGDHTDDLRLSRAEVLGEDAIDAKTLPSIACTHAMRLLQKRKTGILSGRFRLATAPTYGVVERRENPALEVQNLMKPKSFSTSLLPLYRFMDESSTGWSEDFHSRGRVLADISGAMWEAVAGLLPKAFSNPRAYIFHHAHMGPILHKVQLVLMRKFLDEHGKDAQFDDAVWYHNELVDLECFSHVNLKKYWAAKNKKEGTSSIFGSKGSVHAGADLIVETITKALKKEWKAAGT